MMWGYWNGAGWGWSLAMMAVMVAFWLFVIYGILSLLRWAFKRNGVHPFMRMEGDEALQIVKRRYARGEINREDYLRLRRDLERE